MVIFNSAGRGGRQNGRHNGTTTTALMFLPTGQYYIKFEGATLTGESLPNMTYSLRTLVVSDPIDPFAPDDPTTLPGTGGSPPVSPPPPPNSPPPSPPPGPPPGTPSPPPPEYTTQDQGDQYYLSLGLIDLWSNPWMP